jgi:CRP/FNR family transcriptional regulator, cyclic AMP receptor protein
MAGRVLKVLEEQGLLRATGKTIVVFNARPKIKTRPVIVPAKPGTSAAGMAPVAAMAGRAGIATPTPGKAPPPHLMQALDEDEDEDDDFDDDDDFNEDEK